MVISGTLFLEDMRRRAFADRRLFLVETTLIAGLAALLTQVKFGVWGPEWKVSPYFGMICVGVAIVWAVIAAFALHHLGRYHQGYAMSLLADGGLLYLALEHEPAESFAALRRSENRLRLSASTQSDKSFRQRMIVFVRKFAKCASACGFQPYPAASRLATLSIGSAVFILGALFIWLLFKSMQAATLELPMPDTLLHTVGQVLIWLVLAFATINHVRQSAPKFALVELLLGEAQVGRAVLTSR